jgi:hypothetical protein
MSRRIFLVSDHDRTVAFATEKATLSSQTSEEVVVQAVATIVDTDPLLVGQTRELPLASFVGIVRSDRDSDPKTGELVIGVGPPMDIVSLAPSKLQIAHHDASLPEISLALLPLVSSILIGVRNVNVRPRDRVLVSGGGLAARLTAFVLESENERLPQTVFKIGQRNPEEALSALRKTGDYDVLIDTTADPSWWPRVMPLVRKLGRVLLLLPPGPQLHDFNFYPDIHSASLTLLARRVPSEKWQVTFPEAERIMLQNPVSQGHLDDLLWKVKAEHLSTETHRGLGKGRGLAVCWLEED